MKHHDGKESRERRYADEDADNENMQNIA